MIKVVLNHERQQSSKKALGRHRLRHGHNGSLRSSDFTFFHDVLPLVIASTKTQIIRVDMSQRHFEKVCDMIQVCTQSKLN